MELIPVERNTLVQSVVDQIVRLIKNGALAPGDRLPSERELMKHLAVGRSTIREALRSLEMMNLVELRPGQGSFVKDLGVQTVIRPDLMTILLDRNVTVDLLEVRKLIEPATVELAAHRATDEEMETLQALLDRCQAAHAAGESTAGLSAQFHMAIAQCAHNGVLVMFMESILGLLTERGSKLEHIPSFSEWELASHQKLVDALRSRDGHLAHRLMSRHLEESARRLLDSADGVSRAN
jgi:GntR family transcriptional regulator, transcriptional repressor for pyruvate dehydrogenase complex